MGGSYRKYLDDFDSDRRRENNGSGQQRRQTSDFDIEGDVDDIDLFSYNTAKQRHRNEINSYLSRYDDTSASHRTRSDDGAHPSHSGGSSSGQSRSGGSSSGQSRSGGSSSQSRSGGSSSQSRSGGSSSQSRNSTGSTPRQMHTSDDKSVRSAYGMERRPASTHPATRRTGGDYIGSKRPATPSKQSMGAREVVSRANKSANSPAQRAYTVPERNTKQEPDGFVASVIKSIRNTRRPLNRLVRKLAVICILLVGGFFLLYYSIVGMLLADVNMVEIDTKWTDAPVKGTELIDLKSKSYIHNVLLLGIDDDGSSGSRSDTIIIASINTREDQIKLCSILRDNYVEIPGYKAQKINAAYAYGGTALTMQTIQNNYRIKLDKYVSVNMASMANIVDSIGGVDIELSEREAEQINLHSFSTAGNVSAGMQHLDGKQAVCYAQIRKIDSDFGRTGRQRILLEAIMSRCRNLSKVQLLRLVGDIAPCLTTNMSTRELGSLALKVLPAMSNGIEQMHIPVEGSYSNKMIDGASVLSGDYAFNAEQLREFIYG